MRAKPTCSWEGDRRGISMFSLCKLCYREEE